MSAKKCIVRNCVDPSTDFAILPKDHDRRMLWLHILERLDIYAAPNRHYICYNHFRKEMFGPSGKRLTGTAIPFLDKKNDIPINSSAFQMDWSSSRLYQLPKEEDANLEQELNWTNVANKAVQTENKAVQTEKWLLEGKTAYLGDQIAELKQQLISERAATQRLQRLQNELHSEEHLVDLANKYLPPEMAGLIENIVSNSERSEQGYINKSAKKEI